MSYDQRKKLEEELDKITHRQDMRRAAKEINETGIGGTGEVVNRTVAHWAEQILREHYGSSNYGYRIKTSSKDTEILLDDKQSHQRDSTVTLREEFELERDYTGAVGFAEEGELKRMKDLAVEWFETHAVRVADDALDKIHKIEERRMMERE